MICCSLYYIYRKQLVCLNWNVLFYTDKHATRKSGQKGAKVVNTLLVISSWFGLMYVVVEFPLIALPPPDQFCPVYHRIKQICYGVCLVSVYLTLWFRVFTAFYWDKVSKKSTSSCARFFNFFAIAFLVTITISNYIVFLSGPAYVTQAYGCAPVVATKSDRLKWIILGATTIVCQLIMLASLIYPLYLHRNKMLDRGCNTKTVIPLIKRSALMTGLCIASDLVTSVFATSYKSHTVYINHVVFSTNLLVNITCVICSFSDHREKLFPFPCCVSIIPSRRLSQSSVRSRYTQSSMRRGRGSSVTTVT